MKRIYILGIAAVFLVSATYGCSGLEGIKAESDAISLDQWLEEYAFQRIADQLKTNSFMKGLPFIIVRSEGEATGRDIGQRIDTLTEEIRERMNSHFLQDSDIRVIRRHPVSIIDRPYTLQEAKCGRTISPKLLLAIDIRRLGDRQVRISIRAVDVEKNEWIRGFSLQEKVVLTQKQNKDLDDLHPDQYLKGLKYVPFSVTDIDEIGAYIAANLSCIFREAYEGEVRVFIDSTQVNGKDRDITWFVKKQLLFCNEIRLTNNRKNADWVLVAESRQTGIGTGLSQFWVEVYRDKNGDLVKGLSTYAYYESDQIQRPITGRWKIINLPSRSVGGFLRISGDINHGFLGDLYGTDGVSLIKRGIFIQRKNLNLDWAFHDDQRDNTFKVSGILSTNGKSMSVRIIPFSSHGEPLMQELVREEE